jgi:hypothetical protein
MPSRRIVIESLLWLKRKTVCPLSVGLDPINLAIPRPAQPGVVLAAFKHAVRRFAVAFGHA